MTRNSYPGSAEAASKILTNDFLGANSFANFPINLLFGQIQFPSTANLSIGANVLDDYEKGLWTAVDGSGAGLAITAGSQATYIKIGRLVFVNFDLVYPATASGANSRIDGLPFQSISGQSGLTPGYFPIGTGALILVRPSNTVFDFITLGGGNYTNINLSGQNIIGSGVYRSLV